MWPLAVARRPALRDPIDPRGGGLGCGGLGGGGDGGRGGTLRTKLGRVRVRVRVRVKVRLRVRVSVRLRLRVRVRLRVTVRARVGAWSRGLLCVHMYEGWKG